MGRIKDLLLKNQEGQDQPNPNEIKLSFNDQWFLLTTMLPAKLLIFKQSSNLFFDK